MDQKGVNIPDDPADSRPYDIHSAASMAEFGSHVLKYADTFAVYDRRGDLRRDGNGEQGLYHRGTRHLSRLELWMGEGKNERKPVLLNSAVRKDNSLLTVNLTNPDFNDEAGRLIPHGVLHFFRAKLLWEDTGFEHLRIRNYGAETVDLSFSFVIAADFADIFEVRGTRRNERGEMLPSQTSDEAILLGYRGRDGVVRGTHLGFSPGPRSCSGSVVRFHLQLPPHEQQEFYLTVFCEQAQSMRHMMLRKRDMDCKRHYEEARDKRRQLARRLEETSCQITTSNEEFNAWVDRSQDDLNLLLTETPEGLYPYAGIPWFNTFFGRDGLLTALMTLWTNPDIARGVLGYLAGTQAKEEDADRVAQPGKILHESREGEMAATGEIPFQRYYGTVDATPLFVLLAGAYEISTGDHEFIERLWPNIEQALHWIDTYGDLDGDGFVEYEADEDGLTQQGWKDSEDSVFHADGMLAEGPIALCEVQGYVYAAKCHAARMAGLLGKSDLAEQLSVQAEQLQQHFQEAFWCEELSMYALALDGKKRPCQVRTSNAGHTLFTGIASNAHADKLANALFENDMFCGWGIRTLSERELRYNPLSYHNGSVWPHDNSLIGWGLGRYEYKTEVHRLLTALFAASKFEMLKRLSELFCGFIQRPGEGPTPYPVACAPQAWASAVPFVLLQASLGLSIKAAEQCVEFHEPRLPPFLLAVELKNLKVGKGTIDVLLERHEDSVSVKVMRRDEGIKVMTVK
ncbi:MAG: amylo-alpha-1,6-glucosidase [Pseudohongiellaceae bacterium]